MYVVTSASMVSVVQRNVKNISADPFFESFAARLSGVDDHGKKLMQGESSGGGGLTSKIFSSMIPSLLGKGLDALTLGILGYLQEYIDQLETRSNESVDLFDWCKESITIASTDSIYGAKNPYRSKKLRDDFW